MKNKFFCSIFSEGGAGFTGPALYVGNYYHFALGGSALLIAPSKNNLPSLKIVDNFFNKYPSSELAEANLNYDLIYSIFICHIRDFLKKRLIYYCLLKTQFYLINYP